MKLFITVLQFPHSDKNTENNKNSKMTALIFQTFPKKTEKYQCRTKQYENFGFKKNHFSFRHKYIFLNYSYI